MFTAVDWEGNEDPAGFVLPSGAFYHLDVQNAFSNAPCFAANVAALPGQKYVIAHSLGNMMVSSAIKDFGLVVNRYFMLDAAVAIEAYNSIQLSKENMRPLIWREYAEFLWSSEWHVLWNTGVGDSRTNLTWRNRFGDIPNTVNYYSSGEDVLKNSSSNPPFEGWPQAEGAWYYQEFIKGEVQGDLLPYLACHGGWGFNSSYNQDDGGFMPASVANAEVTPDMIRTNSFFRPFYDSRLYATNPAGSILASDPVVRAKLLAEAIPALSFATGSNSISNRFGFGANLDMNGDFKTKGMNWPRPNKNWEHSDYRVVAYSYNYGLYDDIKDRGDLK